MQLVQLVIQLYMHVTCTLHVHACTWHPYKVGLGLHRYVNGMLVVVSEVLEQEKACTITFVL